MKVPAVKDRTLAKPVEQESPFCCHLDENGDIENDAFERQFFLEVCSQIGRCN
jgi:hypothetical protein